MPVGLSLSSESSTQDKVLGAGCGLAGFEAEHWEQSQTSALYVGKAALPTQEWLCYDGMWGGDQLLAMEGLRISTAERRRSSAAGGYSGPVSHTLGILGNLREPLAPAGS